MMYDVLVCCLKNKYFLSWLVDSEWKKVNRKAYNQEQNHKDRK